MKHNTFEPCKDHENGHFNWCLLCEIENLRKSNQNYLKEINRLRIKTADPTERVFSMQDILNCWIK